MQTKRDLLELIDELLANEGTAIARSAAAALSCVESLDLEGLDNDAADRAVCNSFAEAFNDGVRHGFHEALRSLLQPYSFSELVPGMECWADIPMHGWKRVAVRTNEAGSLECNWNNDGSRAATPAAAARRFLSCDLPSSEDIVFIAFR